MLYPRAEQVPPALETDLAAAGAELVSVPLYRTVCPAEAATALRAALPAQVITLSSGSAARHLAALLAQEGLALGDAALVVIGPSTAKVCAALALPVAAVASPHTAEGLARAVHAWLGRTGAGRAAC